MVAIPPNPKGVVHLIYQSYEKDTGGHRPHLGASLIGRECERELWYIFRWFKKQKFSGRMLRLFQTGHLAEQRFVNDLRAIGVQVEQFDSNGKQITIAALGGHFGGSLDAALLNVPEAPKTWHVGEFKTHGEKSFLALVSQGVEKSKPEHFAQMQIYMGETGMTRALYLAVNKNTDELYYERINYDEKVFAALMQKADRIVFSEIPLPKLSKNPSFFKCKFCNFADICHYGAAPESNYRNDGTHYPARDGTWQKKVN